MWRPGLDLIDVGDVTDDHYADLTRQTGYPIGYQLMFIGR